MAPPLHPPCVLARPPYGPLVAHGALVVTAERIQVPKGTFDVLGEDALARDALLATVQRILERAGYERIETPTFEATELFARGVGAATDIVRKEMYTFEDAGGRSLTLRPEGTAPVCRAYMEHGMHKRPQPVKLWYLRDVLPRRAAAGGALPPVLADRGGVDRLRGPGRRRRADRAAVGAPRGARRAGRAAADRVAGHPGCPRRVPGRASGLPARPARPARGGA